MPPTRKRTKKRGVAKRTTGRAQAKTTGIKGLKGAHAQLSPGDITKFIAAHFHAKPRCEKGQHHPSCDGKVPIDVCRFVGIGPLKKCVCAHPKIKL